LHALVLTSTTTHDERGEQEEMKADERMIHRAFFTRRCLLMIRACMSPCRE
jgi:hypothetical protein